MEGTAEQQYHKVARCHAARRVVIILHVHEEISTCELRQQAQPREMAHQLWREQGC
jgi:hypothetical protein